MNDLRDLYQELILDHSKNPRNFGTLPEANCHAKGHNPLCGDQLDVYLLVKDGIIQNAHFSGSGCAISTASASLMTDAIKGKTETQAKTLFHLFHHAMTDEELNTTDLNTLEKLAALLGVRDYPMRVKCATLAWHTLEAAFDQPEASVSTE